MTPHIFQCMTARPWTWLCVVTVSALVLGGVTVWYGIDVDTDIKAFEVRGTVISNRAATAGILRHRLGTVPPLVVHVTDIPAAPVSPAPPNIPEHICMGITRSDIEVLVTNGGHDVLGWQSIVSMCKGIERFKESAEWKRMCFGETIYLEKTNCYNKTVTCQDPVWLLTVPKIVATHPAAGLLIKFTKTLREYDAVADFIGFKADCRETGTVPCDAREALGCGGGCDDPCVVSDVDICELLVETDATVDEMIAISETPTATPACDDITEPYVTALLRSMNVITTWARKSTLADQILPLHGGRALFVSVPLGKPWNSTAPLSSTHTRISIGIDSHQTSKSQELAGIMGSTLPPFTTVWREWSAFNAQLQQQLLLDGRWAVGSVLTVIAFTLYYSRSVFLSCGAILGILLCLPLTLAIYRFVMRIQYVGLLHLIALFLIAGIGTDDFFVVLAHYRKAEGDPQLDTTYKKVTWAVMDSLVTVTATTFTTAGAFMGNFTSDIAPIKLFGLFMALMMLCLLATVAIWFPPLLYIYGKRREKATEKAAQVTKVDLLKGNKEDVDAALQAVLSGEAEELYLVDDSDHDEADPLVLNEATIEEPGVLVSPVKRQSLTQRLVVTPVLLYYRYITLFFVVVLTITVITASRISGPTAVTSLWPSYHNQAKYFAAELQMDTDVGRADIRLVWGLAAVDTGDHLNPLSRTGLRFDTRFNGTTPAAQEYFVRICKDLENRTGELLYMARKGSVECPVLDIDRWLRAERNMSLPLPSWEFVEAARDWWWTVKQGGFANIYYTGDVPRVFTVWVGSNTDWQMPYTVLEPEWKKWEGWLAGTRPPAEVKGGFQSAGGAWVMMETQRQLVKTAGYSLGASLGLAFLVLLVAGGNVVVTVVATGCIAAAAVGFVAFMVVSGWEIGVIESICMTIVIGMSCDYTVHICSAHTRMTHATHPLRIQEALTLLTPPVLAASFTTIGASIFLLNCTITFLFKFGAFIVVTLTSALVLALYVYPSIILTLDYYNVDIDKYSFNIPWPSCRSRTPDAPKDSPHSTDASP